MTRLRIDEVADIDGITSVLGVFDEVWDLQPSSRPLGKDTALAIAHAGNPVLLASSDGRPVGASLGVLGSDSTGKVHVHSHMTGVVPDAGHRGVGRALKFAQRDWALRRGIDLITWTFDPLVARNGWFNLVVLGAVGTEYHVDFYGPIDDAINGGDETDRVLASWAIAGEPEYREPAGDRLVVEIPADIVALRRSDPTAARAWRTDLRARLAPLLADGWVLGGMSDRTHYVMVRPR
jgi:predicted GNAT superfamily acetyltransferase